MSAARPPSLFLAAALVAVAPTIRVFAAGAAERSAGGLTLVAPDDQLDVGLPYYVMLDDDSQIVVTSTTSLLRLSLTSSRVVGYVVAPFDLEEPEAAQQPVLGASLRIPVHTLAGGSATSRNVLLGDQGLAAAEHPEIGVLLKRIREPRRLAGEGGDEVFRFAFTAELEVEVKGKTVALEAPIEVTYLMSSRETMARYVGDMAVLRSSFELELADLGIAVPPPFAPVFSSSVDVDVFLALSTVTPDKNLDPSVPPKQFQAEQRFLVLLRDLEDDVAAYAHAERYARTVWDDDAALGRLARLVVAEPGIERRRLGFARRVAEQARELDGSDPLLLNTLARIQFEAGDEGAAVATQKRALELVGEAPARSALEANLERYEAASG